MDICFDLSILMHGSLFCPMLLLNHEHAVLFQHLNVGVRRAGSIVWTTLSYQFSMLMSCKTCFLSFGSSLILFFVLLFSVIEMRTVGQVFP